MSLDLAVRTLLLGQSSLAAIVGTQVAPQGDVPTQWLMPYATYALASYDGAQHMGGASGLAQAEYTLHCYATSNAQAAQMEAALGLLDGLGHQTIADVPIRRVIMGDREALPVLAEDGSQKPYHERIITCRIWHIRPVVVYTY